MTQSQTAPRPYYRTPALAPDGRQIAFVYAGDIWLVDAQGGPAERLTAHPSNHSRPRWSPDSQRLAFTSDRTGQGDIYILSPDGEDVQRVTFHDAGGSVECWTPDGAYLFFSSDRDRQSTALYRVAVSGGTPAPWISQPYEQLNSLSVSPDGSQMALNLSRDRWWRRGPNPYGGSEIWLASSGPGANDFRRLSNYVGMNRWPLWADDGQGIYFVSDRDGNENIWYLALEDGSTRPITHFGEGRVLWPAIGDRGRTIVFERDFGLWRLDLASGDAEPITIRVRPDAKTTPVQVWAFQRQLRELALSPDGKKVAFVAHGEVFADFADKETDKECRQGASFRLTNTAARERDIAWMPDSRRLVYVSDRHSDEEVYLYDFTARGETRLTESAERAARPKNGPTPSPDGVWIAYAFGDDEIRLIDTRTREDRPFVRGNFVYGTSLAWSPDSAWLAFVAQDDRLFSNLYLQRVGEDQPHQVTFLSNLSAHRPIWAPNGQFIVFTTGQYRAEAQIARVDLRPQPPLFREEEFEKLFAEKGPGDKETKRPGDKETKGPGDREAERPESLETGEPDDKAPDQEEKPRPAPPDPRLLTPVFAGIERRLRFLTPTQLDARAQCISPDSRDLVFSAVVAGKPNLWAMPLDEPRADQPPRQLTGGPGNKWAAQFAPDGKSFYFLDNGQINLRKYPNGDQSLLQVSGEVTVDFHQEKRQIFDECWRLLRDHFYDPTFRGLNWGAAREQFAPLVAGAQTTDDLHAVLNLMVGELRASHLGAYPTWSNGVSNGYLGLLFDPVEQAATGRLRIAAVVPDSPAVSAGDNQAIGPGDYLLAVDDTAIGPRTNLDLLLQRTVGRRVRLLVGPPRENPDQQPETADPRADDPASLAAQRSRPGTREIAVRPVSAGQYDALRYRQWVQENEAYVHRVSGGRLGYVHIREMNYDCYQQFLSDLDAETHSKEGVVIDVRYNGGGHIATFILDVLTRRSVLLSTFRDRPPADAAHLAGNRVLNKPTVLVANERSGSNTEIFIEGYRRLGLGKVVGRPTAGAVIGTFDMTLLDGTRFRLPRYRYETLEGDTLEGTGRAVDVDVMLPLGETAAGRDPQLDAAVRTLLAEL